jgi:hypothetical protein
MSDFEEKYKKAKRGGIIFFVTLSIMFLAKPYIIEFIGRGFSLLILLLVTIYCIYSILPYANELQNAPWNRFKNPNDPWSKYR